ncbi:GAF domain-containing sensor histidine kinase [Bradyrhizobium canariense]|uniref:histidine kinase n=1 Tax=Bradyrhizobium canariense TaxID=255045 RepID=A0A1H2BCM1_9BRAD|nr:ATP-binding protein [Bradyrhizobium canariense]SDT55991.1 PAS domain S-box-containing protein [Bradyrhizobium canariense]
MNESIHGERTASEPQDRSSSVAHSIEVPSEIIRKWQEIVNLLAEIMHVPSACIMRVDPPHIKVFVSSRSEGNPCEPGALDTGPYCETVMKTGQPLLIPDALENEAWKANPHVRLGMISYLGVPIGWPNGRIFGTICVRDNKRNEYSEAYLKLLLHFRDMLQADLKSLARLHGEIEERETKIRRLVDSNIMGVFIWDFDGRILEANDEFLRMVSYDREDLVSGRIRWADLTPPDWRDRNNARIEQQKSSGRFESFEKEYIRKDGSRVPVLIGGATFEEGGNQGVAYVLDLTERKRVEAEARENEQRYREAQLELAHANRVATMGQLTASIAHEVNQPLSAVVANAEACLGWLRRRTPDVDAACRSVEWIIADGNRASEVIRRVRALANKTSLEKVPLDVNDVVRETIPLVQRELISHQVLLRMELAPTLPMILGDRVQLQQVIINLVMNGIESMQSVTDQPRELAVRSRQDETQQVLVSVADCGVGISAENADRLFTAFFTTKSSGMGMGLSICRSIIDAHGGRLWAATCEPRGALFQFTIPAD